MTFHVPTSNLIKPSPVKLIVPRAKIARRNIVSSQSVGVRQFNIIRARLNDGALRWTGIFEDPEDFDVFFHAFVRHCMDGTPIPRDIARLPSMPWFPGLDETPLQYEFATAVSFTSAGGTTWNVPVGVTATDYLVVAGGGAGGRANQSSGPISGGGGGAGGLLEGLNLAVSGSYTITVGAGGTFTTNVGNNGANSSIGALVSALGGGGGGSTSAAAVGGSGGGAPYSGPTTGAAGTSGQGNSGGTQTFFAANYPAAGGGGAGAGGGVGSGSVGGAGGVGLQRSISGSNVYYAGGGGGALFYPSGSGGPGGLGGGGAGGRGAAQQIAAIPAVAGTVNTGGGGGGGNNNNDGVVGPAADGGRGIVWLSYTVALPMPFSRQRRATYIRR